MEYIYYTFMSCGVKVCNKMLQPRKQKKHAGAVYECARIS